MLEPIVKEIGADSAALMVPNIKEKYNYCYTSYNMPREWVEIKNSFDEKVPGGNVEVYKTGKPAITNRLSKELEGHYIESVMAVPVIRKGKTVSVLELVHTKKGKTFSRQDLALAQSFTQRIEIKLPEEF